MRVSPFFHAHYPVDSQKPSTMETRNWAMCCISHVLLHGPFSRLITLWGLVDLKCVRRLCACLHYMFLISFTKHRCLVSRLVTVRQKTGVKSASTETVQSLNCTTLFSYPLLFFPARIWGFFQKAIDVYLEVLQNSLSSSAVLLYVLNITGSVLYSLKP